MYEYQCDMPKLALGWFPLQILGLEPEQERIDETRKGEGEEREVPTHLIEISRLSYPCCTCY